MVKLTWPMIKLSWPMVNLVWPVPNLVLDNVLTWQDFHTSSHIFTSPDENVGKMLKYVENAKMCANVKMLRKCEKCRGKGENAKMFFFAKCEQMISKLR